MEPGHVAIHEGCLQPILKTTGVGRRNMWVWGGEIGGCGEEEYVVGVRREYEGMGREYVGVGRREYVVWGGGNMWV